MPVGFLIYSHSTNWFFCCYHFIGQYSFSFKAKPPDGHSFCCLDKAKCNKLEFENALTCGVLVVWSYSIYYWTPRQLCTQWFTLYVLWQLIGSSTEADLDAII